MTSLSLFNSGIDECTQVVPGKLNGQSRKSPPASLVVLQAIHMALQGGIHYIFHYNFTTLTLALDLSNSFIRIRIDY